MRNIACSMIEAFAELRSKQVDNADLRMGTSVPTAISAKTAKTGWGQL